MVDRWALHIHAYTWYRYQLIAPFLIRGPIQALNIGTGGGLETLRLLRRGNFVTTIELDRETAQRTRRRIERNGFGDRHTGREGHVLKVELDAAFHEILMSEVLEHIAEDLATLRRLSEWLLPGGRLILSTPTASYGQLPGDTLSVKEDGGHVRVGYDGPELDEMLKAVGLIPLRRVYNGHLPVQWVHRLERCLHSCSFLKPLGYSFSLLARPFLPCLDFVAIRPFDQITVALKKPGDGACAWRS